MTTQKIPYLKIPGSNQNPQLVDGENGCFPVSNAHLYDDKALPVDKAAAAAKSEPPPDVMETFVAWLRAPAPAPKVKPVVKIDELPVVQYKFKLRDLPTTYSKVKASYAADCLTRWFKGALNYSPDAKAAKLGYNQNGQPYAPAFIDGGSLKLAQVLEQIGQYGKEQYEALISQPYLTQANTKDKDQTLQVIANRLATRPPKDYRDLERVDMWDRCKGDSQKIHNYHFQQIEMNSALFFWKDIGMALGDFKLYVAPAKGVVDYYREGTITTTITEVYVYLRKHFSFAGQNRYLGNCNKSGVIFVEKEMTAMLEKLKGFNAGNNKIIPQTPKGVGSHVAIKEPLSESTVYFGIQTADLLAWQKEYKQGGDFIIFSDMKRVTLREPIVVDLKKSGWDARAAVRHANANAEPKSISRCARYTREAIEAGGIVLMRTESAKDYGASLIKAGFYAVNGEPKIGDVVIIQSVSDSKDGHMAIFDGLNWISDFVQLRGFYPGLTYRKENPAFQFYRHD